MTLTKTTNNRTGARRYFVDGRRVTREAYDAAMFWRRVDTFLTVTRGDVTRQYCEVRA